MILVNLLLKLIVFAKSDVVQKTAILIRDLLFGYILLLACAIFPICGWHRVWLGLGWWWLYPLLIVIAIFGYSIGSQWLMYGLPAITIIDALSLWQIIVEKHKESTS